MKRRNTKGNGYRNRKRAGILLAALLLLLSGLFVGCGSDSSGSGGLKKPADLSRTPECADYTGRMGSRSEEEILTPDDTEMYEFRSTDLSGMDLSELSEPENSNFDSRTVWPDRLPETFRPQKLEELGRDPGLNVRKLHEQGITGKGVGIAIIDQTLLVDHVEYADRLRYYREYQGTDRMNAQMHGPAVASIAAGSTVGTAPEALLYYIADSTGREENGGYVQDMNSYAADVDRIVELNSTLAEGEKIRVISMSIGVSPDTDGAPEFIAAVERARKAGIAVFYISETDPLLTAFLGMGRAAYGDPNELSNCLPGLFLLRGLREGGDISLDRILIPMDRRTTAAATGQKDYAYYPDGGMSWTMPYLAGVYAMAYQVKPDLTQEEFTALAVETARPVSAEIMGSETVFGKALNPEAIIDHLAENGK